MKLRALPVSGGWQVSRPPAVDVALAVALTIFAVVQVWIGPDAEQNPAAVSVAVALGALGLAWRRRAPLLVVVWLICMLAMQDALGSHDRGVGGLVIILVALYSLGNGVSNLSLALGLVVAAVGVNFSVRHSGGGNVDYLFAGAVCSIAVAAGRLMRAEEGRGAAAAAKAEALARERDAQIAAATADERARIAQEMHDVIAHSVSVIAVQAGAGRRLFDREPKQAYEALVAIEAASRDAYSEMRRLLHVVRSNGPVGPPMPQPSIGDVGDLVEKVRGTGLVVSLEIAGEPRPLPPGVDLACYRIVQEALTNVMKHAGAERATVRVAFETDRIELDVRDDGRTAPAPAITDGVGHGLLGMRERVALYGGSLEVGPSEQGGYAVHACLPVDFSS